MSGSERSLDRLFVYGSLRSGGRLSRLLSGERTLATAWGWSIYGYGPAGSILYPVAVAGGSGVVVGEVVEVDWDDPEFQHVARVEVGAGYVIRRTVVHVAGEPVGAVIFAWEHQDHDWVQHRIESGDWLTYEAVGR